MMWPSKIIGTIANVNPKLAPADRPDLDEKVSFVPMAAVSERTLRIETEDERPFSEVAKGYTPFKRGDVLIAKITPCFENGKMALADNLSHELGFGTTEFHVLRPSEQVSGSYLFHLLRAPYVRKAGAMKMKGAAGQRRVPADFFASLQIPLPPLAEQKRIAGILDAADALRAKRRESLAQLDTLLQSTFLDMFGDPVTNPMGWQVRELADVVKAGTIVTYGIVQAGEEYPGGIPYIRTGDLVDGEIRFDELRHTAPDIAAKFERSCVRSGEIVMSIRATVGTTARVPRELDGANLTQGTARISPGEDTEPWFLLHFIRTRGSQDWLQRQVKGATFREITLKRLSQMPINVPPLDVQRHFSAIVESIEKQKANQRAHLAELDTLFASLQSRAFRGDL